MFGKTFGTCICAALMACLFLTGCAGARDLRDVAAYVGDEVVYEDEVTDYTQQLRDKRGYADDDTWAKYLNEEGMTGKTWRESVIRQMADRILVRKKAEELGITPDQDAVTARIEAMRKQAGAVEDDVAWSDYLAATGQTPEGLREDLEFSSIEQQVVSREVDLSTEVNSQMCDDYLHLNLADQVVRHYCAFEFALDDEKSAEALVAELSESEGEALLARFGDSGKTADLGWDFEYAEYVIDPELKLRKAKLDEGQLYKAVLVGADALRVVACIERVELESVSYDEIKSESLKARIKSLTQTSQWAALTSRYLDKLETEANVQVVVMPEGLPYDVVD